MDCRHKMCFTGVLHGSASRECFTGVLHGSASDLYPSLRITKQRRHSFSILNLRLGKQLQGLMIHKQTASDDDLCMGSPRCTADTTWLTYKVLGRILRDAEFFFRDGSRADLTKRAADDALAVIARRQIAIGRLLAAAAGSKSTWRREITKYRRSSSAQHGMEEQAV